MHTHTRRSTFPMAIVFSFAVLAALGVVAKALLEDPYTEVEAMFRQRVGLGWGMPLSSAALHDGTVFIATPEPASAHESPEIGARLADAMMRAPGVADVKGVMSRADVRRLEDRDRLFPNDPRVDVVSAVRHSGANVGLRTSYALTDDTLTLHVQLIHPAAKSGFFGPTSVMTTVVSVLRAHLMPSPIGSLETSPLGVVRIGGWSQPGAESRAADSLAALIARDLQVMRSCDPAAHRASAGTLLCWRRDGVVGFAPINGPRQFHLSDEFTTHTR